MHGIAHQDMGLQQETVAGGKLDVGKLHAMVADTDRNDGLDVGIDVIRARLHRVLLDAPVAGRHDIEAAAFIGGELARIFAHLKGAHADLVRTHLHGIFRLVRIGVGVDSVAARFQNLFHNAALAFAGKNVAGCEAFLRERLAELAGTHQTFAGRHLHHLLDLVTPEYGVEEMSSLGQRFFHNALIGLVRRQQLVRAKVLAPAVHADQELAGRHLHPLHLPMPELLHDQQGHHGHAENHPRTGS